MSYSFNTSLCITEVSLDCREKLVWSISSCAESNAANAMVVTTVVLGRGSAIAVGRKSKYTSTCPGLNMQNMRSDNGVGSHTASSQTSFVASGCALDSAVSVASMLERNRSGEEERGEESTRTRWADGVLGTASTEVSKSL